MIKPSIKFSIFAEQISGKLKSKCKIKDLSPQNLTNTVRSCIQILHKQLTERKDHMKQIRKGLSDFTRELQKIESDSKKNQRKSRK